LAYQNYWGAWLPETGSPQRDIRGTANSETILGTDGNDVFEGGGGRDTYYGYGGDDYYWLRDNTQIIVEQAGGGIDTLRLWHSMKLPSNVENLIVFGDGNYAIGNAGDNIIQGLEGRQFLYGGLGADVLIGGSGADTFITIKGEGAKVIQDFEAGWGQGDQVRLTGSSFSTFEQVKASMVQQGSDVVLNNGGEGVIFRNVTIGQFAADDFQYSLDYSKLGAMTFNDDFNSLALNTSLQPGPGWMPNFGNQGYLGSFTLPNNGEQQIYVAPDFQGTTGQAMGLNPFSVNNGVLTIRAAPVSVDVSSKMWGYQYASGVLTSQQSLNQTYGYFEIRAELPVGQGLWPAFWLRGSTNQTEIDILEALGSAPYEVYQALHSPAVPGDGMTNFVPNPSGFHTYGAMWAPDKITYYLDGVAVYSTTTPSDMHAPMHMIFNLAVGGNWAGSPDGSTPWPGEMKVDYVRVWQLPGQGTSTPPPPPPPPAQTGNVWISDQAYTAPSGVVNITLTGARQTVTGNGASNVLTSNNGVNILNGMAGDDILISGRDGDTLTGGSGSDTFAFPELPWNGTRITDFTPGEDKVDISGLLARSGYGGADPVGAGYLKFESDGAGGARILFDHDGPSDSLGHWVVSTLAGIQPGQLSYQGVGIITAGTTSTPTTPPPAGGTSVSTAATTYTAAAGVAQVTLTGARQTVTGNELDNTLISNNGINKLIGGAGNDTLIAGRDSDTLTGGSGNDIFRFPELPWNGGHITDFTAGQDVIDISGMLARAGYGGADPIGAGYLKISAGSGGAQIWFDHDGPSGPLGHWLVTTLDGISAGQLGYQAGNIVGLGGTSPPPTGPALFSLPTSGAGIDNAWLADPTVTMWAGLENLTLSGWRQAVIGNASNNLIVSNNSINVIDAGGGNDIIVAGRDADRMTGGTGNDIFRFDDLPWNSTRITDFADGVDLIDLRGMFTKFGYQGSNPVGDGWLKVDADGAGSARIWFDPDGPGGPYGFWQVTTVDNISPTQLTAQLDWYFQ